MFVYFRYPNFIFPTDFSATVTNLQAKVESLTTTNALMKEDLSIAKNNILSLQEENRQLKKELGIEVKDANEVYIHVSLGIACYVPIGPLVKEPNLITERKNTP